MRKINFRGKCKNDGQWVYGYYRYWFNSANGKDVHIISDDYGTSWTVEPESVGQLVNIEKYTIYEGDVINVIGRTPELLAVVSFDCKNCFWKLTPCDSNRFLDLTWLTHLVQFNEIEVVGNIIDNPVNHH